MKGDAEYKAAQAKGYSEGTQDRMTGLKDSMMGSIKGDDSQRMSGMSFPYECEDVS